MTFTQAIMKISAKVISDKEHLSKIHKKNFKKSIIRKQTTQIKKWAKDLSRHLARENKQI
jgi:hypothetical protein